MDERIFEKALSRAQELMNDENFNRLVESKASKNGITDRGSNEFSDFENIAFGGRTTPSISNNNNIMGDSKLPDAIKQSFINNPSPIVEKKMDKVVENFSRQNTQTINTTPQTTYTSQNIDYSLIKSLIDESISRHLKELTSGLLTESSNILKGFKFGEGNKIQFVDKKGNLYEGELKLKRKKMKE